MAQDNETRHSFEEMKSSFIQRLIKEDRCFSIKDNDSKDTFRIDVCAVNPHNAHKSCWQPGIIRRACEEILWTADDFKKSEMIHVPDISKDFILNKAVRDATNILLKPYMPAMLSESRQTPSIFESQYEMMHQITQSCISNSQDFLLKMATIAWDFLNVLNAFQNNVAGQGVKESDQGPLD